jgi:hypothetical protein
LIRTLSVPITPSPDVGGAFGIRGFVIAEFLKPKNAGEQSGILLRQALGVQLSPRRISSALCGAMFAPTYIFRSHIRGRQSNSAYDDQQQHDIETHIDHPSMNLKAPTAPPEGYSIDCKEPIPIFVCILPVVTCLVKSPEPPPNSSIASSRGRKSALAAP